MWHARDLQYRKVPNLGNHHFKKQQGVWIVADSSLPHLLFLTMLHFAVKAEKNLLDVLRCFCSTVCSPVFRAC